jgi:hypothetical protein
VPAAAREHEDLDHDPVPGACKAVAFALKFDIIMGPARLFHAGVASANQQVEHPEE